MAHDARAVANYFLDKARESGEFLSHLKLQKLVFFAHGWTLALTEKPLIKEPVEAWEYGPVIRTVFNEFKRFGGGPIIVENGKHRADLTDQERRIIDRIWELYGSLKAFQLSNLTHLEGAPWRIARERGDGDIPNSEIMDYFKGIISNGKKS